MENRNHGHIHESFDPLQCCGVHVLFSGGTCLLFDVNLRSCGMQHDKLDTLLAIFTESKVTFAELVEDVTDLKGSVAGSVSQLQLLYRSGMREAVEDAKGRPYARSHTIDSVDALLQPFVHHSEGGIDVLYYAQTALKLAAIKPGAAHTYVS